MATTLSTITTGETVIKLPYPYQTEYAIEKVFTPDAKDHIQYYKLCLKPGLQAYRKLPLPLHSSQFMFSEPVDLKSSQLPSHSNNSPWARARRSPCTTVCWEAAIAQPTLAQAWMLIYLLFTIRPAMETVRLHLKGINAATLGQQLKDVVLVIDHPPATNTEPQNFAKSDSVVVLALRSTFWQGAGSPFGPRPIWCPEDSPSPLSSCGPLSSYPPAPLHHIGTVTTTTYPQDSARQHHTWHPIRPAKPIPGTIIYSRWIPHLNETFSMISFDWQDPEHLKLFHDWQNDPRVSQGWNQAGTLEQHRDYLRKLQLDQHQFAVLAKWDDTYFAYFELYWAKENEIGAYYDVGDFDRGRYSLVGDVRFRGPHRVSAWWSGLMHYLFLDDPRTMHVVGEPKDSNSTVIMYDLIHGFGLDKFIDLPHKRSAFMRCHRERFFQLCPLGDNEKAVGGIRIGLVPKL